MSGEKSYKAQTMLLTSDEDATGWEEPHGTLFRCEVHLHAEIDGRISAIAVSLPGVASQGDDEREALANVTEALEAAIEDYKESKQEIPWLQTPPAAADHVTVRWVFPRVQ